eukprot:scaffold1793_cov245-Pinguiococcus_pyrenoidosus.AAC.6
MVDGGWWMVDGGWWMLWSRSLAPRSFVAAAGNARPAVASPFGGLAKREEKRRKSAVLVPAAQACADERSVGGLEPGYLLSTSPLSGLSPRFYASLYNLSQ